VLQDAQVPFGVFNLLGFTEYEDHVEYSAHRGTGLTDKENEYVRAHMCHFLHLQQTLTASMLAVLILVQYVLQSVNKPALVGLYEFISGTPGTFFIAMECYGRQFRLNGQVRRTLVYMGLISFWTT
jgi:hypothetical protein